MYLLTDIGDDSRRDNFSDFSEKELEMIRGITDSENETSVVFWATCALCYELACWGAKLSSFFHSCPVDTFGNQDKNHVLVSGRVGWVRYWRKVFGWMTLVNKF